MYLWLTNPFAYRAGSICECVIKVQEKKYNAVLLVIGSTLLRTKTKSSFPHFSWNALTREWRHPISEVSGMCHKWEVVDVHLVGKLCTINLYNIVYFCEFSTISRYKYKHRYWQIANISDISAPTIHRSGSTTYCVVDVRSTCYKLERINLSKLQVKASIYIGHIVLLSIFFML